MLASPQTMPLFLQKYQRKQLKQYQRREPIYKGMGDIICCLDESISTAGNPAAWGKAVALTLLEIAADGGRNFALVHFSDPRDFKRDLFRPGTYTPEDKLAAAERFLNGGTNFETPMREAMRLMKEDAFENAGIVFITDGQCMMPEDFLEELRKEQTERRFTITGVLLDSGSPGMDFSLKAFCQNIYRTSELAGEDIVRELVGTRI
nr:VWA domain-containing protein [uncultured Oscillibacter sp.]